MSVNGANCAGTSILEPALPQDQCAQGARHERRYRQTVLGNVILIMLIPYKYLKEGSLVSKKTIWVGNAARTFKRHMEKMPEDEMSEFVQALDVHERERP